MLRRLADLARQPMIRLAGFLFFLLAVAGLWGLLPAWPLVEWHMPAPIKSIRISDNGKILAAIHDEAKLITLWDVETGQERLRLPFDEDSFRWLSPDGQTLVYGEPQVRFDVPLKLWNWSADAQPITLADAYVVLALSPKEQLLVTRGTKPGSAGGFAWGIRLWEIPTGRERPAPFAGKSIWPVIALADGRILAVEYPFDNSLIVWDVIQQAPLATLEDVHHTQVVLSKDGKRIAAWTNGKIKLWELPSGAELARLNTEETGFVPLQFLGDGRRLILGPPPNVLGSHAVEIWDPDAKPSRLEVLPTIDNRKWDTRWTWDKQSFSPDGQWLLIMEDLDRVIPQRTLLVSVDGQQKIFDENLRRPQFSPDGQFVGGTAWPPESLVSRFLRRDREQIARVWQLPSGHELTPVPDCDGLQFFANGKRLATWNKESTIRIWDLPPRRPMWVEYGLPVALILLLLLLCCYCIRLRRRMKLAAAREVAAPSA